MNADTKIEMVDRFIQGQMSREEAEEFERLIEADEEIKALVQDHRTLIKGMEKYQEKVEFFNMLDDIKKDKEQHKVVPLQPSDSPEKVGEKHRAKLRKLRYRLAYAAGIAFLVTAALFMLNPRVDTDSLAASNFSFHSDLLSAQLEASGATDDINREFMPLLRSGIEFYNKEDYSLARDKFEEFAAQAEGRNYLVILNDFYLGQIALFQDRAEEAIGLLNPLLTERGLPIESAVKWYLSLAYLKQGEVTNAMELLEDLQTNEEYGLRSREMMETLD